MKTNRILSAALIVFAATACNTDYTTENFSGQDLEPMKIAGVETKTVFNPTETGGTVNWTVGDHLAIFDNKGGKNIFNNSEGAAASFSGNVTAGTEMFWGIYPAELATSESTTNGILTATLPATQTPAAGTFAEELNISVTTGFKTPGTPEVTDISFHNVCGLISFTVPQRISAKKVTFSTESRELAGTLEIDCDNCTANITGNGSKSVSMEGNFAAGSTFYFVVTPGEITGYRIDVETNAGSLYYKSTAAGTLDIKAGDLKKLGTIDFKNGEMTASASHTYSDGQLTGTALTINHGIPQNMWKDVTALSLTVSKGGTNYRTYSATSVNGATITPTGNIYLPQGTYTISGSYTMNGEQTQIKETNVTVLAPTGISLTSINGVTSYSLATGGDVTNANTHQADRIIPHATVSGVSEAVLSEVGLSYTFSLSNGKSVSGTTTSSAIKGDNIDGNAWATHTLTASGTFDGVNVAGNGSSVCHITGLPYYKNFRETSDATGWTFDGTANYLNDYTKGYVIRYYYNYVFSTKKYSANAFSPSYALPTKIKAHYSVEMHIAQTGLSSSSKTLTVRTGVTTGTNISNGKVNSFKEYDSYLTKGENKRTVSINEEDIILSNGNRISISVDNISYSGAVEHYAILTGLNVLYVDANIE